ncbi:MAG: hypothetical protein IT580_06145 [Verrucomicrobiales bacterium]|nr:hypothetical protein [Verrucomicrobiales bacterium]
MAVALLAFHAAWVPRWGWVMAIFPCCLIPLIYLPTLAMRWSVGLVLGLAMYGPHLHFFWTLFGPAAAVLWLILAFWPALFLVVGGEFQLRLPTGLLVIALPILWTGLEYFRSELYFLRFSWLTPGLALAWGEAPNLLSRLGVFGTGFLLFTAGTSLTLLNGRPRWLMTGGIAVLAALLSRAGPQPEPTHLLRVAGAQIESATVDEIPGILDRVVATHPDADLIVLPEYSLDAPPSPELRQWCSTQRRHVIVGGREPLAGGGFRNTAWVLDPRGETVFSQVKSVPIQFFDDGEPATSQALWDSPWGALGIAICYDLSYTRVIDSLARLGAQGLIIPTMDSVGWGRYQHQLHARIAPARAAEYGIPIVRCASSGISQLVNSRGGVDTSAPFSDEILVFAGNIRLGPRASLPADRTFAPLCTAASVAGVLGIAFFPLLARRHPSQKATAPPL